MATNPESHRHDCEARLAAILKHFDHAAKDELTAEFVQKLDLNADQKFAPKIRQLLDRELIPAETIKLDILFHALAFHDEESEEEEE